MGTYWGVSRPVTTAARNRPLDFHGRPVFEEVSGKRTHRARSLYWGVWGRCAVYGGLRRWGREEKGGGIILHIRCGDSWDSTGGGRAKGQPGDAAWSKMLPEVSRIWSTTLHKVHCIQNTECHKQWSSRQSQHKINIKNTVQSTQYRKDLYLT